MAVANDTVERDHATEVGVTYDGPGLSGGTEALERVGFLGFFGSFGFSEKGRSVFHKYFNFLSSLFENIFCFF